MKTRYQITIEYLSADGADVRTTIIKIVATGMPAAMHHALASVYDFKHPTKVTCELVFEAEEAQP